MGRHTTKPGESSRAEARPPLPYPVGDGRIGPSSRSAMERRSRRRRSRLAALSAASMLAVGGAAGVSMATADEPEASSSGEIAFSGGCGTLSLVGPSSQPDSEEITVTEGSRVSYRNDLGVGAELHVGDSVYEVGADSTEQFVMNRSVEVAMVPDCPGLFAEYDSAQVNVVAAPADEDESDRPEGDGDSTGQLPDPGADSGSDGPSGSEADAEQSDRRGEGPDLRGDQSDQTGREAEDGEDGEDEREEQTEQDESEVDAFAPSEGDEAGVDGGFTPASDEVAAVDAEAVSDGASGLLALVAIVCLVGVAAAAMRTILKQRAAA
ncbi:hypothetical protein [Glycomyces xiaoerkulensis]|uniref:hypothetical protein n=1 Tax=Glycomyces xiaoerkulensis TaxID=2038139 RepID=UPI0012FFE667|nr:hypothetical protein [Glycomyces xiaoerkulensis]